MAPIISINNLSKSYRLGQVGAQSFRDDLHRLWCKITGKPDPTLTATNILSDGITSGWIKALDDVSFSITPGERVGIIGKNGAGKSTLLKMLARITTPSSGNIELHGRLAALLEVGTGFHPEFTGRENIFLNGTILGMTRKEVQNKLDIIAEFSGIEKYLDTPVKRYSSGMRVRLGFAVAAHLEPDILVVDEVLAVGDAEFQRRALGKMDEVSKDGGRTILFVSHNMNAIQNLCDRCIVLDKGRVIFDGETDLAIQKYIERTTCSTLGFDNFIHTTPPKGTRLENVELLDPSGKSTSSLAIGENYTLRLTVRTINYEPGTVFVMAVKSLDGTILFITKNTPQPEDNVPPNGLLQIAFTWQNMLSPNQYEMFCRIKKNEEWLDVIEGMKFEVTDKVKQRGFTPTPGIFQISAQTNVKVIER